MELLHLVPREISFEGASATMKGWASRPETPNHGAGVNDRPFFEQADLMLRVLPHFAPEKDLVLKGGTAINWSLLGLEGVEKLPASYLPFSGSSRTSGT
jgi:hypothetical protein